MLTDVPDDFPRDVTPASLSGAQMKLAGRLIDGRFVVGQTPEERAERWDLCEDLAQQLVPKAQADAAKYPNNAHAVTLQRIRNAMARKGWVTVVEMDWLIERLRVLLEW
ncbi:hypothetical protein QZM42_05380 [Burkholderia vietnamiensis]|uniref:hypothetical protein n=1 Tax=Burkholderia vietnamiensis TaxID=60552 RepID=UPI0026534B3A|nr:hypothetical protein [Burkholderia vietnamiensis]MDN7407976.1 hypothetical protein [Burkholderia vietnamiensis]